MINKKNLNLPVIPLADTVIFPGIVSPVISVREISRIAISESLDKYDGDIIVATQKNPDLEMAEPDNLFNIAVLANISDINHLPDNSIRCRIKALQTVNIENFTHAGSLISAEYNEIEIVEKESDISQEDIKELLILLNEYVKTNPHLNDELINDAQEFEDVRLLINFIISNSLIPVKSKIQLLKEQSIESRLNKFMDMLSAEIEISDIQDSINEKVRDRLEKNQKQYYLNEQLKVIRKELGKEEDERINKLKKKMESKELPEKIIERINDELERLKKIPTVSPEFGVLYNYVEWLLKLPWLERVEEEVNLNRTRDILEKNHYGLDDIKERVLEYLSVLKLKNGGLGQILCFVGPPGVGKTSLGMSVAEALNRNFLRVSLGGIRDEAEIRGHRKTYVGSMPGKIIQKMAKANVKNPVFLLDEIDKLGKDFRGDPASALLEVLDPEVNYEFNDHYIEEGFDLSQVLFITTANTTHTIPPTLLDRMETISLPGYLEYEKIEIARNYLIPKVIDSSGLEKENIRISESVLQKLVREYTREAGVRELERFLRRLSQKAAKKIAFEGKDMVRVTMRNVKNYLGVPKYRRTNNRKNGHTGVANGLAVTRNGGEVIRVESRTMEGGGKLTLTGQLGDIMQESAKAALSFIRSNWKNYNLDKDFYKNMDLHIHVPEGAVPKDGPSAGITIFSSILSGLTGKPTRDDLAMTGEITLSGDILRVGGLREKIVAAQTSNFKHILLPEDNRAEVEELPNDVKKGINIIFAESVSEGVEFIFKDE